MSLIDALIFVMVGAVGATIILLIIAIRMDKTGFGPDTPCYTCKGKAYTFKVNGWECDNCKTVYVMRSK